MAKNKLAKPQRVSVSKRKLNEKADELETSAVVAGIQGELETIHGAKRLDAATDLAAAGAVVMGKGASDLTRAEDTRLMSERMAVLSEVVSAAGAADVAQGAAMLAASEDVSVMSALVGLMSADDIEHGLELARLSGEMQTAGELIESLKMPVLSVFLARRAARLHEMSVEQIRMALSTRAVSDVLASAGQKMSTLGENEMEEGVARLTVSAVVSEESVAMANASNELAAQGLEEIVAGAEIGRAARVEVMESANQISTGSAAVGASLAMEEVAATLRKKSEK
jgi:hypothetical protein